MTQSEDPPPSHTPSGHSPEFESTQLSEAERVFCEYVRSTERLDTNAFEELCAARPELEADLRQIHFNWTRVSGLLEHLQGGPTFGERLRQRYGSDIDPAISLDHRSSTGAAAGFESGLSAGSASGRLAKKIAGSPTTRRYDVRDEVARGGMGAIYKIWDKDLRRTLAMKVMLRDAAADGGVVDERILGRFLEEAQITGQLDHPGIVPVHDLGLDSRGRVYFTMRYVRGIELKQVLEHVRTGESNWTRFRVLEILLRICEACAFSHSKGVVHRDLKPANIMVGRFGETYVMDWGLAKVLGQGNDEIRIRSSEDISVSIVRTDRGEESPDSPLVTLDGDVVGTPSYMSPEQAMGKLEEVGPRSDIYAVGCIIYQLLSGQVPYVQEGTRTSPHTVLGRLLEGPPTAITKLDPRAPAELVAVCEKAMQRDASERYGSMMDLAEDLRAFLEGRVVQAYETGAVAEFRAWVARNKALAITSAAAVVIAVLGLASVLFTQIQAKDDVLAANAELESTNDELETAKASVEAFAESERKAAEEARVSARHAEANEELARRRSYVNQLTTVDYSLRVNEFDEAQRLLGECEERYRGWEWQHLALRADTSLLSVELKPRRAAHVQITADGRRVLVGKGDSFFDFRDVETGELLTRAVPPQPLTSPNELAGVNAGIYWSALSSNGHYAAAWATLPDGMAFAIAGNAKPLLIHWDLQQGGAPSTRGLKAIELTDLDPDLSGKVRDVSEFLISSMAVGSVTGTIAFAVEGRVYFIDPSTWKITGRIDGLESETPYRHNYGQKEFEFHVRELELSGDETRIAIALEDDTLRIADPLTGAILLELLGHDDTILDLDFHPSGKWLASASRDATVRVWNLEDGTLAATLVGHDDDVVAVAFDPANDGRLVSGSADNTARVWNFLSGAEPITLRGHHGAVTSVGVAPEGTRIVTASNRDYLFKVWDPAVTSAYTEMDVPASREVFRSEGTTSAVFAHNASEIYSATSSGAIWRWDAASGAPIARLEGPAQWISAMDVSGDGRLLAGAAGNEIWIWSTETDAHLGTLTGHERRITDLGFLPDGRLVSSSLDDTSAVWDPRAGTRLLTYTGHGQDVRGLAIDPTGRLVASYGTRNELHLWDPASAELVRVIDIEGNRLNSRVNALVFDPEGQRLAAGLRGGDMVVWEVETGAEALRRPGGGESVTEITYDPSGSRIVSGDGLGQVQVWGARWGESLYKFPAHSRPIGSLRFEPRGHRLLTSAAAALSAVDEPPRVWETERPNKRRDSIRDAITVRDKVVPLVDTLFQELHFVADVKRRIATRGDLEPAERLAALRFATLRGDDPRTLRSRALLLARPSTAYGDADPALAVRLAERALELEPDSPSSLGALGICLYQNHDYPAAVAQLEKAAEAAPDVAPEAVLIRAYLDVARHRGERALLTPPTDADPAFLMGTSRGLLSEDLNLVGEAHYALAEDLAREVAEAEPEDPRHRVQVGLIQYRRESFEQALQTLEQAAEELAAARDQPEQLRLARSFQLLCNYRLGRIERGDDVAALLRDGIEKDLALTDKVRSTIGDLRSALSNTIKLPFGSDEPESSDAPQAPNAEAPNAEAPANAGALDGSPPGPPGPGDTPLVPPSSAGTEAGANDGE